MHFSRSLWKDYNGQAYLNNFKNAALGALAGAGYNG